MRRGDLQTRWAAAPAVMILVASLAGLAVAGTTSPVDDRPPLLAVEPAPAGQAPAARLVDFEVVPQEAGGYELVLRGDGGLGYQLFTLRSPDRLVLDFPGVQAAVSRRQAEVGEHGLIRVRVGQYRERPEPMARVVLEMERPLAYEITREGAMLRVFLREGGPAAVIAKANPTSPANEPAWRAQGANEPPAAIPRREAEPAPLALEGDRDAELMPTAMADQAATAQPAVEVRSLGEVEAPSASTAAPSTPTTEPPRAEPPPTVFSSSAPAVIEEPPEAPAPSAAPVVQLPVAETKMIQDQRRVYTGKPVGINLVDADIRHVFGMFHELSGLNFVLDPAVAGTVTMVVDEVPWDQALDLILQNNGLEMTQEGNVIRIAPVVKLAQEAAARRTLREAKELEANPITITRTLSYGKAQDVERVIRDAILSVKGRVIIDPRTNTLIIRDIPDRVEAIDKLLATLDAETPQVMIEARMVEVSRDFVQDLGIRWGTSVVADPSKGTQTSWQFPHRGRMDYALNLPRNPGVNALSFSFGNVLDSFTLDITLDALEVEGYAKRLSAPRIATQNNAAAEIEQGVRFPIVNTTATEIQTQFVSASLKMRVTPQITAEGTVILDVEVANDQPDFVNTVGEVPAINTQRAQTKVLIADGGTTVIGGIFTVNEGRSTSGVPWFSKLPGLGWLFRSKNITQRNRELRIFITPRIIKAS